MANNVSVPVDMQLVETALAAELLGIELRTLENWRSQGRGPRYIKVGSRVRYRVADLIDYIELNCHGHTSDKSLSMHKAVIGKMEAK